MIAPLLLVALACASAPDRLNALLRTWHQQVLDLPATHPEHFSVSIELDGRPVALELSSHSLRSRRFELIVAQGGELRSVAPPAARTYRGHVAEIVGSSVAASLVHGRLSATIALPDGQTVVVEPIERLEPTRAGEALHVIYRGADVIQPSGACGADQLEGPPEVGGADGSGGIAGATLALTEIAIDLDFEYFQKNGANMEATVADLETVMNSVDEVFRRDANIGFIITTLVVRTSAEDSYTEQEIFARLCRVRDLWNEPPLKGLHRDLVHHLSGFEFPGSVIGIAWRPGICTRWGLDTSSCPGSPAGSLAYGLSESFYQGAATALFRRVGLTAHEIGHNWSATHCNAEGADNCHIMCSIINGCGGLAGDNLKFDPLSISQMTSHAAVASCAPPIELGLIAEAGPQRRTWVQGTLLNWAWSCGNVAPDAPQRRFAMAFTVAPPAPGAQWALRRIVGKGFIPPPDAHQPGTLTALGWTLFSRAPGNGAPTSERIVAEGVVPLPFAYHDSPDEAALAAWPIDLPTPLPLSPGDYYLSIHGDNGGPSAPAAWSWLAYAPSGVPLLEGGLHAWRSSTGPFESFTQAGLSVQQGDSPDALYSLAFLLEGTLEPIVCDADLTGDGAVSGSDIAVLLGSWGACSECAADLDGSGTVDGADIAILLGAWGECPSFTP